MSRTIESIEPTPREMFSGGLFGGDMDKVKKLTDLPVGYSMVHSRLVGVGYFDEKHSLVLQHPVDSEAARGLVWEIYRNAIHFKRK